jgi:hypothetical protein
MTASESGGPHLSTPLIREAPVTRPGTAADRHGPLVLPNGTVLTVVALSLAGLGLRIAILTRPLALIDRLFIPDDTFYTLTIARSLAHGHGPTVDGTTLTSGFQPLLGFLMTPVFWLTNSADAALRVDLAVLVVMDAMTILVLAWIAYRLAGKVAAIVAAALWAISPVGIAMSLGGLETSLAMLFEITLVALWIWANDRRTVTRWVVVGAVAGLTVLARTDALLLVGLLGLIQLWRGPRRPVLPATLAGALVLAPWWIWCAATFGTPLPTSGPAAHHLQPFGSFSSMTVSLAAGAVSGGPFAPSDWLRSKLISQPSLGVIVFWVFVVILLAVGAWLLYQRPRRRVRSGSAPTTGPGVVAVVGTLPVFAAGLLVFYAWFGVTFYFTRYLAPVALVVVVLGAGLVGRIAESEARWRSPALIGVATLLAVPTVAAGQLDSRDLTTASSPHVALNSPHFYDTTTGYREPTGKAVLVPPAGSVVGGWQSGALSYFAQSRITVVNLDGVVNPTASALRQHSRLLAEYVRRRHIDWLADFPLAVLGLAQRLKRLDPGIKLQEVAAFPAVGASPSYEVVKIVWSGDEAR